MAASQELEANKMLVEQFKETRDRTLEIVKTLEKDDFVVQTSFFMSPPKWHVGHVSWIYEVILSKLDKDYEFYSKEFSEYLNSYYQQFGVPHDKGLRGVVSRPTTDQIFQYFNTVNQRVEKVLESQIMDEQEKGLVRNPSLETALADAESLRDSLLQSQERFFDTSIYITIYADEEKELRKIESDIIREILFFNQLKEFDIIHYSEAQKNH